MRTVSLRAEHDGRDHRYLRATLNTEGALVIEGQDLGPKTALVSSDGEYEWSHTILREHIPQLLILLGEPADADILSTLERHWTGPRSYEWESRISESDIPSALWIWSG
ncbi:MAG: hypothetical protein GC196_02685 [Hyphomonas sp.]|nr:hypothetical protein [Hyphomonas sp.]